MHNIAEGFNSEEDDFANYREILPKPVIWRDDKDGGERNMIK